MKAARKLEDVEEQERTRAETQKSASGAARVPSSGFYGWHLLAERVYRLLDAGRVEEALAVCNQHINQSPNSGVGYAARAGALGQMRRYEEAIVDCDKAIALESHIDDPDIGVLIPAYAIRANALLLLKRFKEGIADVDRGIALMRERFDFPQEKWLAEFLNEQLFSIRGDLIKGLGESKSPDYTVKAPPSEAADTPPLRMADDFNTTVKKAKAENLARAKPRPKPRSSVHQLATYRALVEHLDLLNPELPEVERKRRAKRLVQAYGRVRERRPKFHDTNEQLRAAFRIVNSDLYQRRKARKVKAEVTETAKLTM